MILVFKKGYVMTAAPEQPIIGERRFAVYLRGLPVPQLRNGWMHFGGLSGKQVTALASPNRLLTREEAVDWKQAMRAYDPGVIATIHEFVPIMN